MNGGPLTIQWLLLWLAAAVAAWWILVGLAGAVGSALRRRRRGRGRTTTAGKQAVRPRGRGWRAATLIVGAVAAVSALAIVVGIVIVPGLVDVGFLGESALPLGARLLLHLPLAVTVLTAGLLLLLAAGAARRWWTPSVRGRDAALATVLTVLAVQLSLWHMVGWGL